MTPPEFIIIGAMKCATSTLHAQFAKQRGVFMTTPKEPNFFSDDDVHGRGVGWYRGLFDAAPGGAIRGESSTHYTKLPTHPCTVDRLLAYGASPRLIYVMRDPVDRLVSQYIHEWTEKRAGGSIDDAVEAVPGLVDYGRYAMQLAPWIEAFGRERILLVFFERLRADPQGQLERVCGFIGAPDAPVWDHDIERDNASGRRLRKSPLRDAVVEAPGLSALRRRFVPRAVRERAKRLWQMRERPSLGAEAMARVRSIYDEDLARLGAWTGLRLTTDTFAHTASQVDPQWAQTEARIDVR